MSKKWYNYFVSTDAEQAGAELPGPSGDLPAPVGRPTASPEQDAARAIAEIAASVAPPAKFAPNVTTAASFDEIYAAAEIKAPAHGYTVSKVSEMLQSPHIRELPREIKKSSVLVALEASAVKVQDIIQDAVRRDKALDAFEVVQRRSLAELERKKTEENQQAQAEVDRLLADFRAKIQANNDALAKEKVRFETWLQAKHVEEQKIADTVGYFVSENPVSVGDVAVTPPPARSTNPA
jgi:hypothetical protein